MLEEPTPNSGALRRRLRPAAQWLAYVTGLSTRRARRQRTGRILMLHGIGGEDHPTDLFEEQLCYLKRHFRIVPLGELISGRGAGAVALTFDDGLRNSLTDAYPVLRRLGLPATFFVCPGLVEERRWLWSHEMRARLAGLAPAARGNLFRGDDPIAWMKTLPPRERAIVEARVRAATPGFEPTPDQRQRYDLMDWDDLGSLDPAIVTIGSHTLTHPILTTLPPDDLSKEVRDSRRLLEERLGRPVRFFCYPNGSHDDRVVACVKEHYDAAVTADHGFFCQAGDPWRLHRILTGTEVPRLAWYLHRPG